MFTWFRLYHDLPNDIKMRRFSPSEKWAWVALLCLASQSSNRGIVDADNDDIADYCEFNCTQDWLYLRDKLIAKGMLEIRPDGTLAILHWDDRQYDKPSDRPSATKERKRRQRNRSKQSEVLDVTPSHANVTSSHAIDTDTDTDPDPDQSQKDLVFLTHSLDAREEKLCEETTDDQKSDCENTVFSQPDLHCPSPSSAAPLPIRPLNNLEKPTGQWWGRWRTGNGPNEWNEGFIDWMTHNWIEGQKRSRSAVIGYIVNCEKDTSRASLQKLDAYYEAYEDSWEAQTGHSSDDKWLAMAAKHYENDQEISRRKSDVAA